MKHTSNQNDTGAIPDGVAYVCLKQIEKFG